MKKKRFFNKARAIVQNAINGDISNCSKDKLGEKEAKHKQLKGDDCNHALLYPRFI